MIVEMPVSGNFIAYEYEPGNYIFIFEDGKDSSEHGKFAGFLCKSLKGNAYKFSYVGRGNTAKGAWARVREKESLIPRSLPITFPSNSVE